MAALLLFAAGALAAGLGCGAGRGGSIGTSAGESARPGAISGRALSLTSGPLATAHVSLVLDGAEDRVPMASTRTARDGAFKLAAVPPGRYVVRAAADGHAEAGVRLELRAGETLATVLRLDAAQSIEGHVEDRKGRPVPGARILAWRAAEPRRPPSEAFTDDEGRFVLQDLARGAHRLLAEAAGFGSAEVSPVESPSKGRVLRLDAEGRSISGVVVAQGAPVAGARVLLGGESLVSAREAQTGAEGRFTFKGVGPGVYAARASLGERASKTAAEIVVDAASANAPDAVRLELQPAYTVAGRVVEAGGGPLPGSEVTIEALPGDDPFPRVLRADAGARWSSGPMPAGEYRATAARPGYVTRQPARFSVGPGKSPPSELTLELVRGAQVIGQVVDEHQAGVSDAVVRCLAPGGDDLTVIADRLPPAAEAAALPSGTGHALALARTARVDSTGRFVLPDMLPGRFRIEVARAGVVVLRTDTFALGPGQRLDIGRLAVPTGVALTGRVVDENQSPVAGAHVSARELHGTAGRATSTAAVRDVRLAYGASDGSGQFKLPLAPGEYLVTASAGGMVDESVQVRVLEGAPPGPVTIRLVRAEASLEGLVRDTLGRPLARARVIAWPASLAGDEGRRTGDGEDATLPPPSTGEDASPLSSATADVGGHFTLARLPQRSVLLEIKHPDYPGAAKLATPGTFTPIRVSPPGGIEGEVRDRASGGPVSTYRAEAHGPGGRRVTGVPAPGGRFTFARLYPGRWSVTVRAPGFRTTERDVDVPAASELGVASVRELRIEIDPDGR